MSQSLKVDVVIVGGGPAGISAAIWCKRLGVDHLLIESSSLLGGQLPNIHNQIIDYPGCFNQTGTEVQQLFINHLEGLGCRVMTQSTVKRLDGENKCLVLDEPTGIDRIDFQYAIMATGSSPRKLEVPGEAEMIKRREVYSATRDRHHFRNKQVAVIGGGDRAFEGALLLAEAGAKVTIIHRSDHFRARQELRTPVFEHPEITVKKNAVAEAIHGSTKVEGVKITYSHGEKELIPVDAVFVRIGVKPNSLLVKHLVDLDDGGYIRTSKTGKTSEPSIYAVGDVCTSPLLSSIASSTGQGMLAAKEISFYLNG